MAQRKRLRAEERREHLLDVAAQLMLEHGFEAVTMESLKERAGISRGLAYVHFENVEELVFALYEREMTELERRLEAMHVQSTSFDERVKLATQTYFDFIVERGGLLATLQLKLPQRWLKPSVKDRLARMLRYWTDELVRAYPDLPLKHAQALARSVLAAIEMIAAGLRSKTLTRGDAEHLATHFVLGGLRRAAAGPK